MISTPSFVRDRLGDEFITGVLHTGARLAVPGDWLMALPINLLWNGQFSFQPRRIPIVILGRCRVSPITATMGGSSASTR